MRTQYPCGICKHAVAKNHKAIQCDNCNLWVHIKCNKIIKQTYNILANDETSWYCIDCSKDILPFSELNQEDFHSTIQGKKIKFHTFSKIKRNPNESILLDKLSEALNETDSLK